MKRFGGVLLTVVMLIGLPLGAYASSVQPLASEVIAKASVVTGKSSGKVSATGKVTTNGTASKICISSMVLYEKQGDEWVVKASDTNICQFNASACAKTLTCAGVVGRAYKCVFSGYATVDGATERFGPKTSKIYTFK